MIEHRRPSSGTSQVARHINKDCPGHSVYIESVRILDRSPSCFEHTNRRRTGTGPLQSPAHLGQHVNIAQQ